MRKRIFLFLGAFCVVLILLVQYLILHNASYDTQGNKLGIAGPVIDESEMSLSQAELSGKLLKVRFEFDAQQRVAYAKTYPGYDISSPMMTLAQVLEVDSENQKVKIKTDDSEGWVLVSPEWHGNTLVWDDEMGDYAQVEVLNVPKGQWQYIQEQLAKSKKVMFLCLNSLCQETIGGHIYLD